MRSASKKNEQRYVYNGFLSERLPTFVKAAEERYSNEVLAHAESIKAIDHLKRDLATAQVSARDNLTAAETANAKLSASEDSWMQQKAALDKEVTDLNAR